jgi:hypothetical protein
VTTTFTWTGKPPSFTVSFSFPADCHGNTNYWQKCASVLYYEAWKNYTTSPYGKALQLHRQFLPSPSDTVGSSCGHMLESPHTPSCQHPSHTMAGTLCSVVLKLPRNYGSSYWMCAPSWQTTKISVKLRIFSKNIALLPPSISIYLRFIEAPINY